MIGEIDAAILRETADRTLERRMGQGKRQRHHAPEHFAQVIVGGLFECRGVRVRFFEADRGAGRQFRQVDRGGRASLGGRRFNRAIGTGLGGRVSSRLHRWLGASLPGAALIQNDRFSLCGRRRAVMRKRIGQGVRRRRGGLMAWLCLALDQSALSAGGCVRDRGLQLEVGGLGARTGGIFGRRFGHKLISAGDQSIMQKFVGTPFAQNYIIAFAGRMQPLGPIAIFAGGLAQQLNDVQAALQFGSGRQRLQGRSRMARLCGAQALAATVAKFRAVFIAGAAFGTGNHSGSASCGVSLSRP